MKRPFLIVGLLFLAFAILVGYVGITNAQTKSDLHEDAIGAKTSAVPVLPDAVRVNIAVVERDILSLQVLINQLNDQIVDAETKQKKKGDELKSLLDSLKLNGFEVDPTSINYQVPKKP